VVEAGRTALAGATLRTRDGRTVILTGLAAVMAELLAEQQVGLRQLELGSLEFHVQRGRVQARLIVCQAPRVVEGGVS